MVLKFDILIILAEDIIKSRNNFTFNFDNIFLVAWKDLNRNINYLKWYQQKR